MNQLYFGDNLTVLRESIPAASVDLVYLDPPFNSKATYNVLFKAPNGHDSDAQITAFEDTWHWGHQAEQEFDELLHQPNTRAAEMVRAFRQFLGENDMMAYLVMMANRLLELHRVLKPTGSLYLHCDPTASHYLKIVLDSIFGVDNFQNEIIWKRTSAHSSAKRYGPVHDVLLFYGRTGIRKWNQIFQPYDQTYVDEFYTHIDEKGRKWRRSDLTGAGVRHGETGSPWRGIDVTAKGRHWAWPPEVLEEMDKKGHIHWPAKPGGMPMLKRYLDEQKGMPAQDIIADIPPMHNLSEERLGYPTQKPLALLERIIRASSNEGDLVLDPFCGCGTAVHAAQKLSRQWIGIDITHLAVSLIEKRMKDAFPGIQFEVHGTPKDAAGARALAGRDKYQFQWWACSLVNAQPYLGRKKGADSGVDGVLYFLDGAAAARTEERPGGIVAEVQAPYAGAPVTSKKIVVSVKGGEHLHVAMIRDLVGVVEREKAEMGLFVSLVEPTQPMRTEAAKAGFYVSPYFPDRKYPRIQLLTVPGLLEQREHPLYPDFSGGGLTFKQARREADQRDQKKLFD